MNYVDVGQFGGFAFDHLTAHQQHQYRNQGYISSSDDSFVGMGRTVHYFKEDEPLYLYDPTPEPVRKPVKPFEDDDWDKPLYDPNKVANAPLTDHERAMMFDVEAATPKELAAFAHENYYSFSNAIREKVRRARDRLNAIYHQSDALREEADRLTQIFGEGFTPAERAALRRLFISGLRWWMEQERRLKERYRRI